MSASSLRGWIGALADRTALTDPNQTVARQAAAKTANDVFSMFAGTGDGDVVLSEITDVTKPFDGQKYAAEGIALLTTLNLTGDAAAIARLQQEVNDARDSVAKLTTELTDAQTARAVAEQGMVTSAGLEGVARQELNQARLQVQTLQNQVTPLQAEVDRLRTQLTTEATEAGRARNELANLRDQLASGSSAEAAQITQLVGEKTTLEQELQKARKAATADRLYIDNATTQIAQLQQKVADLEAQISAASSSDTVRELAKARTAAAADKIYIDSATAEIAQLKKQIGELTARISTGASSSPLASTSLPSPPANVPPTSSTAPASSAPLVPVTLPETPPPEVPPAPAPAPAKIGVIAPNDPIFEAAKGKPYAPADASSYGLAALNFYVKESGLDLDSFVDAQIVDGKPRRVLATIAVHKTADAFNAAAVAAKNPLRVTPETMQKVLRSFKAKDIRILNETTNIGKVREHIKYLGENKKDILNFTADDLKAKPGGGPGIAEGMPRQFLIAMDFYLSSSNLPLAVHSLGIASKAGMTNPNMAEYEEVGDKVITVAYNMKTWKWRGLGRDEHLIGARIEDYLARRPKPITEDDDSQPIPGLDTDEDDYDTWYDGYRPGTPENIDRYDDPNFISSEANSSSVKANVDVRLASRADISSPLASGSLWGKTAEPAAPASVKDSINSGFQVLSTFFHT